MQTNLTFIMCRTPLQEVNHGKKSGRWGKMALVGGGKVLHGRYTGGARPQFSLPEAFAGTGLGGMLGNLATGYMNMVEAGRTEISIGEKGVSLTTLGPIEVINQYETLERYWTDEKDDKYLILKPRPNGTYRLVVSTSNNVKESVNESGRCLRVKGHDTKNRNGVNAGILMHEAAHPGFLKGCIAPYPHNNRNISSWSHSTSRKAMDEIYNLVSMNGGAELLVMDS